MIVVKRKAGVFKFSQSEERFRKAPFSRQISVDGRRACVFKLLRRSVDRALKIIFFTITKDNNKLTRNIRSSAKF